MSRCQSTIEKKTVKATITRAALVPAAGPADRGEAGGSFGAGCAETLLSWP